MKNVNNKVFWTLFVLSNLIWLPLLYFKSYLFSKELAVHGGWGAINVEMPAIFLLLLFDCIVIIFDRKKKKTKQDLIMMLIILLPSIFILFFQWRDMEDKYNLVKDINIGRDRFIYENAKTYDDCLAINSSRHLQSCANKILLATNDLVGCLRLSAVTAQRKLLVEESNWLAGGFSCYDTRNILGSHTYYNGNVLNNNELLEQVLFAFNNEKIITEKLRHEACDELIAIAIDKDVCRNKSIGQLDTYCRGQIVHYRATYSKAKFIFDEKSKTQIAKHLENYCSE